MIRKIEVNIDKNGKATTSADTFLGICGETNASEVCFILCDELLNVIKAATAEKPLFYRFEVTDAQNRHFVLESKAFEDSRKFSLGITNAFTEYDGKISIALIIESEGFTLYTIPIDLYLEKGCCGIPANAEVYDTVVTVLDQAKKHGEELLEEANTHLENSKSEAQKALSDAASLAENLKQEVAQTATAALEETVATAQRSIAEMNTISEQSLAEMNTVSEQSLAEMEANLNASEQRKLAAEAAALNAISSANSAAQSKEQAEKLLDSKESLSNKETNLMQDTFPEHTKYASAKAVQELVTAAVNSLDENTQNIRLRLEGIKADKTELEAANQQLSQARAEIDATKQELATAKAEIERLKTADCFRLIGEIACDGATKEFYLKNISPLKKIFVSLTIPEPLSTTLGDFSCYANTFSTTGSSFIYTKAYEKTKLFRFYSERIDNGIWKTEMQPFSSTSYGAEWNTSYSASAIDYITALRFSCGDGKTAFLPSGTVIKVYGVTA